MPLCIGNLPQEQNYAITIKVITDILTKGASYCSCKKL